LRDTSAYVFYVSICALSMAFATFSCVNAYRWARRRRYSWVLLDLLGIYAFVTGFERTRQQPLHLFGPRINYLLGQHSLLSLNPAALCMLLSGPFTRILITGWGSRWKSVVMVCVNCLSACGVCTAILMPWLYLLAYDEQWAVANVYSTEGGASLWATVMMRHRPVGTIVQICTCATLLVLLAIASCRLCRTAAATDTGTRASLIFFLRWTILIFFAVALSIILSMTGDPRINRNQCSTTTTRLGPSTNSGMASLAFTEYEACYAARRGTFYPVVVFAGDAAYTFLFACATTFSYCAYRREECLSRGGRMHGNSSSSSSSASSSSSVPSMSGMSGEDNIGAYSPATLQLHAQSVFTDGARVGDREGKAGDGAAERA
jgi:hypothetical protein